MWKDKSENEKGKTESEKGKGKEEKEKDKPEDDKGKSESEKRKPESESDDYGRIRRIQANANSTQSVISMVCTLDLPLQKSGYYNAGATAFNGISDFANTYGPELKNTYNKVNDKWKSRGKFSGGLLTSGNNYFTG